jgi:pimeloyl-ACP methyl ester carboxylesterase
MSARKTPPRTTITVANLPLSHAVLGDADLPAILLLHGWGASIDLVWPLAEWLAAAGYRVHAIDLPGFGESSPPPAAWSVFDYAKHVMAYCDAAGLDRFHLFGHSFGGRLGLIIGAEHGDRVIKMVLSDSAGVRPKTPLSTQMRLKTYKGIRDGLNAIGLTSVSDRLRGWYNRRYGSADFQAASGIMRETFVKVVNQDLLDYAARVKPSTLLLWGERDHDTPVTQGQLLEKTIPDAGLVVFPGAGHYSYLDNLVETVRVMDYFFKQSAD